MLACVLMCTSWSVMAKDQPIVLSPADAATLQGKTLALTIHERPTFMAMTAGKVTFGLFGVAAMAGAGNKLIDDNHVVDPAELVRTNLANLLRDVDGMHPMATDTAPTKAEKPAQVAAIHPEADYVLDVRSGSWGYVYFPAQWGHYWVSYSVQVQLVDTKSGRQLSNAACNSNTHANAKPPTREELDGNGAKLLKDVTTALGWTCVQLLAKEQFHFPVDKVVATPAEFVDPLAALAKSAAPATNTNVAAPVTATAPQPVSTGDAPSTPATPATPATRATPAAPADPATSASPANPAPVESAEESKHRV